MDKFKSFAGQFLLVTAAAMVALWGYEQLNKPKVIPPSSSPAQ